MPHAYLQSIDCIIQNCCYPFFKFINYDEKYVTLDAYAGT